jgi:hypothetical protein
MIMEPEIEPHDFTGTHVTHCCLHHGCKYGEHETCPVVKGTHKQEYPCEECSNNMPGADDGFGGPKDPTLPSHGYFDSALVWHPPGEVQNAGWEYMSKLLPFAAGAISKADDVELEALGYNRIWNDITKDGIFAVYRRPRRQVAAPFASDPSRYFTWIAKCRELQGLVPRPTEADEFLQMANDVSWHACYDDGFTPEEAVAKFIRMNASVGG